MRRLWLVAAGILLGLLVIIGVLLLTPLGLRLAQPLILGALPEGVQIERIEGRPAGPLHVVGLRYEANGLQVTVANASIDWQPWQLFATRTLLIESLNLANVQVRLGGADEEGVSGSDATERQATGGYRIAGPVDVQLIALTVADVRLEFEPGLLPPDLESLPRRLDTLSASASLDDRGLRIEAVQLVGTGLGLDGYLALPAQPDGILDADISLSLEIPPMAPLQARLQAAGRPEAPEITLSAAAPYALNLQARFEDLFDEPQVEGVVELQGTRPDAIRADLPALVAQGTLRVAGQPTALRLQPDLSVRTDTLTGDGTGLRVALSGELIASPGALEIAQLRLAVNGNANSASPAVDLTAQGRVELPTAGAGLDSASADVQLRWRDLRLPLSAGDEETPPRLLQSANGELRLDGSLSGYNFAGSGSALIAPAEASPWTLRGRGQRERITIESLSLTQFGGTLTVAGSLSAGAGAPFALTVRAERLDPAALDPRLTGRIDLAAQLEGGGLDGSPFVALQLRRLAGQFLGQPLSGAGSLHWRDGAFNSDGFELSLGDARLQLSGRVDTAADLTWRLQAPDLARIVPDWRGRVASEGDLRGPREALVVQASLEGSDIDTGEFSVERVEGTLSASLAAAGDLDLQLQGAALRLGNNIFEQASLGLAGQRDQHALQAALEGEALAVHLSAQGGWREQRWRGELKQLDVDIAQEHFGLDEPAELALGADEGDLQPICLGDGTSSLCLSARWSPDQVPSGSIDVNNLPLSRFSPFLPPSLSYDGIINGSAEVRASEDGAVGEATLRVSQGRITQAVEPSMLIGWTGARAMLSLRANRVEGNARVTLTDNDYLELSLTAPMDGLKADRESPFSAQVVGQLSDFPLLAALLPEVSALRARASLDLHAAGTLSQPRLGGEVSLREVGASLTSLGIDVGDGRILLRANDDALTLEGALSAGGGELKLSGDYSLSTQIVHLGLKGENFQLMNTPEIGIRISPDLQLEAVQRAISVSGEVGVPHARIEPADLSGAVSISEDQVLVEGGDDGERQDANANKWRVSADVGVTLGEDVKFNGYGLKASVNGALRAVDKPDEITRATGELTITDGTYRAYGQGLSIDRGRILYSQTPLSNPGLDIIASREARGVRVDLAVRGTLREPVLSLSTDPPSTQSDALSYLVLGRPVSSLQGGEQTLLDDAAASLGLAGAELLAQQVGRRVGLDEVQITDNDDQSRASLVIGKYLSPRLYVSYGLGLFETFNNLLVRYDLTERVSIQTQTGVEQSADLLYSVER